MQPEVTPCKFVAEPRDVLLSRVMHDEIGNCWYCQQIQDVDYRVVAERLLHHRDQNAILRQQMLDARAETETINARIASAPHGSPENTAWRLDPKMACPWSKLGNKANEHDAAHARRKINVINKAKGQPYVYSFNCPQCPNWHNAGSKKLEQLGIPRDRWHGLTVEATPRGTSPFGYREA